MNYLRLLGTLQTFLQHDTAEVLEHCRDKALDQDAQSLVPKQGHEAGSLYRSQLIRLEHPLLADISLDFYPEVDFLWFRTKLYSKICPHLDATMVRSLIVSRTLLSKKARGATSLRSWIFWIPCAALSILFLAR